MGHHTLRCGLALCAALLIGEATAGTDSRLGTLLSGPSHGYERAEQVRSFTFPRDHGPHPGFRVEWWYFTGNLDADSGERFGFQLTFFRFGAERRKTPYTASAAASSWRAEHLYMAHFAISDISAAKFHAAERFSRGALGLAGAQAYPLRVWLEDWALQEDAASGQWHLNAHFDGVALALSLSPLKPVTLQGDNGLSRKSATFGNASYYYSMTRMTAQGTVTTPRGRYRSEGLAWLDREWSTSALDSGQVGWDWFALQLEDGRDVMFYQLRRVDGTADATSAGVVVDGNGAKRKLYAADVIIDVTRYWTSPRGNRRYPAGWTLHIAGMRKPLEVEPLLNDQEHRGVIPYWEGAVRVLGVAGREVGRGYVELTGY
ncbi:MAG: carotenoid 1,2-hydratase [Gammaproteobacteria bacterium]|nr:carotenoid 1,2-hydratase [Gammaproteobacteria bacterium]